MEPILAVPTVRARGGSRFALPPCSWARHNGERKTIVPTLRVVERSAAASSTADGDSISAYVDGRLAAVVERAFASVEPNHSVASIFGINPRRASVFSSNTGRAPAGMHIAVQQLEAGILKRQNRDR
jgi:hypothetical protein